MHHTSKPGFFPWITIFAAIAGFSLQSWLLSSTDTKGLLPTSHPAGILVSLLLALTLGGCFLLLRKQTFSDQYAVQFPKSPVASLGCLAGAAALGYSGFTQPTIGAFRYFLPVFCVAAIVCLLVIAFFRLRGLHPNYLLSAAVTFYLLLRLVMCCRTWGTEPQLPLYFFPLMASVFLLLATFFRTELHANEGNCRRFAFFNQAALFCCCLCIPSEGGLFYLLCALWMAADTCSFRQS